MIRRFNHYQFRSNVAPAPDTKLVLFERLRPVFFQYEQSTFTVCPVNRFPNIIDTTPHNNQITIVTLIIMSMIRYHFDKILD